MNARTVSQALKQDRSLYNQRVVHTSGQEFGRMPVIRKPKRIALHSGDSRSHRMVARYASVGHARVCLESVASVWKDAMRLPTGWKAPRSTNTCCDGWVIYRAQRAIGLCCKLGRIKYMNCMSLCTERGPPDSTCSLSIRLTRKAPVARWNTSDMTDVIRCHKNTTWNTAICLRPPPAHSGYG